MSVPCNYRRWNTLMNPYHYHRKSGDTVYDVDELDYGLDHLLGTDMWDDEYDISFYTLDAANTSSA